MRHATTALVTVMLGATAVIAQDRNAPARKDAAFTLPKGSAVCVKNVVGPPDSISKKIEIAIRDRLMRSGYKDGCVAGSNRRYEIRGYVLAQRERDRVKIAYVIDRIVGKNSVGRITGELFTTAAASSNDPWAAFTDDLAARIGEEGAAKLSP